MPQNPREASSPAPITHVLVCVDESSRHRLDQIAEHLQEAGMTAMEIFALGGIIAGTVPAHMLHTLQNVEGVASVEEEPTLQAYSPL